MGSSITILFSFHIFLPACYLKYGNVNAFYAGSNLWFILISYKRSCTQVWDVFSANDPLTPLQTNEKWWSFDVDAYIYILLLFICPAPEIHEVSVNGINLVFYPPGIISNSRYLVEDILSAKEAEGHPRILNCLCSKQTILFCTAVLSPY